MENACVQLKVYKYYRPGDLESTIEDARLSMVIEVDGNDILGVDYNDRIDGWDLSFMGIHVESFDRRCLAMREMKRVGRDLVEKLGNVVDEFARHNCPDD